MIRINVITSVLFATALLAPGVQAHQVAHHDHIVSHKGPMYPPQFGKVAGINYVMVQNNFNNGDKSISIDRAIELKGKLTKERVNELLSFLYREALKDVPHEGKKWSYKLTGYGNIKGKQAKDRVVARLTDNSGTVKVTFDAAKLAASK